LTWNAQVRVGFPRRCTPRDKPRKTKASVAGGFSELRSRQAYFFAVSPALAGSFLAYLRRKRSMRPAVSSSFCLPVKNGWQLEQISTWMSPLWVERVMNELPQAQCTRTSLYAGWMAAFIKLHRTFRKMFILQAGVNVGKLRAAPRSSVRAGGRQHRRRQASKEKLLSWRLADAVPDPRTKNCRSCPADCLPFDAACGAKDSSGRRAEVREADTRTISGGERAGLPLLPLKGGLAFARGRAPDCGHELGRQPFSAGEFSVSAGRAQCFGGQNNRGGRLERCATGQRHPQRHRTRRARAVSRDAIHAVPQHV